MGCCQSQTSGRVHQPRPTLLCSKRQDPIKHVLVIEKLPLHEDSCYTSAEAGQNERCVVLVKSREVCMPEKKKCMQDTGGLSYDPLSLDAHVNCVSRDKRFLVAKGVVSATFRSVDSLLDLRTAIHFLMEGHAYFGTLTLCFVFVSPMAQCIFIWYMKKSWSIALPYLIPGSVEHLRNELLQSILVWKLSQEALFQNLHELMGIGVLNEAIAGIECFFESLPQLCIQMQAYSETSNVDVLNYISLACSAVGVAIGIAFGVKAIYRTHRNFFGSLKSLAGGGIADLSGQYISLSTGEAMAWLASQHRTVRELDLHGATLEDPTLQAIKRPCLDLQVVDLGDTNVTDDGAGYLVQHCSSLVSLRLTRTIVTDAVVLSIARHLNNLQVLGMNETNITDVGIQHLATNCNTLCVVGFNGTKVTDAGMWALVEHCKGLKEVWVHDSHVTASARNAVRARNIIVVDNPFQQVRHESSVAGQIIRFAA